MAVQKKRERKGYYEINHTWNKRKNEFVPLDANGVKERLQLYLEKGNILGAFEAEMQIIMQQEEENLPKH